MEDYNRKKIVFVVNVDWFFISHRLPLAIHAKEKGFDVYLLTHNTGRKDEIESKGIHFIEIPFERSGRNPFHELKCIYLLIKNYKNVKPNIIHHITLKAALLGSIAAKISNNYNVINAISGLGYNFTDSRNGIFQKILKFLIKLSFKSKRFFFILQNPDDIKMMKSLNLTDESHYCLIKGSGVNLQEYAFSDFFEKTILNVVFPARILLDKGVLEFIKAATLLETKYKGKVIFKLAGSCDKDNLAGLSESQLKKYLIPNYIEWIGFQKDMIPIYRESDIVVLPSYREGLPKSLIEACAIGRPIVTTDVPGCKECVIEGKNGFLVPAKDCESLSCAIEKLIEQPRLRIDFSLESRKLAEREFSIENVINKTFSIYDSILKS
jgi:glycosyltransferase involved in cell wall biosynthesis